MVRHSSTAPWCDEISTIKTIKHSSIVMFCGSFSGNLGQAGLCFFPNNVAMKSLLKFLNLNGQQFCQILRFDPGSSKKLLQKKFQ